MSCQKRLKLESHEINHGFQRQSVNQGAFVALHKLTLEETSYLLAVCQYWIIGLDRRTSGSKKVNMPSLINGLVRLAFGEKPEFVFSVS